MGRGCKVVVVEQRLEIDDSSERAALKRCESSGPMRRGLES